VKIHHLRHALAVADHGSLRAAARELGVAQPAVTRSVQELERELGVALFERRARGVTPTAMGAAFLRRASVVQNELARARDELDQMRGHMHGNLRIAMSMAPHIGLLPYALKPFRARYPDVHLDIIDSVYANVAADLDHGTLDCYIGPMPDHVPEGLVVEKLFDNMRVIMARKGHPLAGARSLRDLVDAEWVTTSITANPAVEIAPLFESLGLPPPRLVLQSHSTLTLIQTLVYTDLLAMLPVQWSDFRPLADALQRIDIAENLPAPPICIIRRAGLPPTPAAEHFCDLIRRAGGHLTSGGGTRRAGQ
jgi:DNA-binding transcriptional LysR family regulator